MSITTLSDLSWVEEEAEEVYSPSIETSHVLDAHYDGKWCILTWTARRAEWRRIIQEPPGESIDFLERHGLIPIGMPDTSHLNLVPIGTFYSAFNNDFWIIYPAEEILREYIAHEEQTLLDREQSVSTGLDDPGRLPYATSYARMPEVALFDFHFNYTIQDPIIARVGDVGGGYRTYTTERNAHMPSLPPAPLNASANVVIRSRTKVLSLFKYLTAYERERQSILCSLGFYLQDLWVATPASFRTLHRPTSLQTLTPTLSDTPFLGERSPVIRTSFPRLGLALPLGEIPHEASNDNNSQTPVSSDIMLFDRRRDHNDPSNPPDQDHQRLGNLDCLRGRPRLPIPGNGECLQRTSNEWARFVFGMKLSGPRSDGGAGELPWLVVDEQDDGGADDVTSEPEAIDYGTSRSDVPDYQFPMTWHEMASTYYRGVQGKAASVYLEDLWIHDPDGHPSTDTSPDPGEETLSY